MNYDRLSTPVPVSEGSQVSGEVGLEGDGRSNLAATGAGNGPGGVVPVPVAAQPRYILDAPAILDMVGRYAEACVKAATTGSPKGREDAREQIRDLWDAIRAALTPVPDVEPDPFDAEADRVLRVYEELTAAKPGDMFAFDQQPGQRVTVVIAAFHEPEPRWGSGPLVDHNPETLRTQREMDADLYENWVTNQEAGTGSADPDGGQ